MLTHLQTPFLQALGYAIANSLWQIAILWLIVILVNTFVRQSSHVKYVTALSAQVAGFVWFLTTFQFYYNHCRAASQEARQLLSQNAVLYTQNFTTGHEGTLSFLLKAEETLPYLSIAYLFLLLFLVAKWIRNFRFTKKLSSVGLEGMDAKWQSFINEMADRLDILQDVKIYWSSLAKSPLTIGYVKPIILVPVASLNHLTTEQLEALLIHELAHIKRADYIINILVSVVEIVLFFNPFTRLLSQQIQKERENCCDDWVLHYQYNANVYAEALLRMAYMQKEAGFQMNAVAGKKGELLQRVKRMVQPSEKIFNYKHQMAAFALITALLFSIAWLQPGKANYLKKESNVRQVEKQVVITPLTAQIDNPFFSAASIFSKSLQEDVNQSLADLDKTITDSLTKQLPSRTKITLQKVTPVVMSALNTNHWQDVLDKATNEASGSLQNIDWTEFQNSMPAMVDSDAVAASVNTALLSKDIAMQGVKLGLNEAALRLKDLQPLKVLAKVNVDPDFLKKSLDAAFSSLQTIQFEALQDSIRKSSIIFEKAMRQQKKAQEDSRRQVNEEIQKAKAAYKKVTMLKLNQDVLRYVPAPAAPMTEPAMPRVPVGRDCTETSYTNHVYDGPANGLFTSLVSEPVYQVTNAAANVKTIHIINKANGGSINIIIEIKQ